MVGVRRLAYGGVLALLIGLLLALAQCAPAATPGASPTPRIGEATPMATSVPQETPAPAGPTGSVVIALASEPITLDPQAFSSADERAINENVMETLVGRDANMALFPRLAESYENVDDTTWRFNLREGITFHNGEPFNAAAAVFSIERIIDPEFDTQFKDQVSTITGATAIDEYTVEITTDGPDPVLPGRLYFIRMVPPEYTQEADIATAPVGTGPYKLVEWRRGEYATLEVNEEYWGEMPKIATATFRFIQEDATRVAALQAGEVDLIKNLIPEQMDQVPRAVSVAGLEVGQVRINAKSGGLLADRRVRQALNYAIDKEGLVESLYGGQGVVAACQMTKAGDFGFNPNLSAYPYDPDKARELLQEAGAEGMTIELVGTAGRWLKAKEATEAIGGYLEEVGLDVTITIEEWQRWVERFVDSENLTDAIYFHNDNAMFDAWWPLSSYYSCEGAFSGYCNPDIVDLVQAAQVEMDPDTREQDLQEALEIGCDDAAHIFLYNINDIYGTSERLEWQPRGDQNILIADMTLVE